MAIVEFVDGSTDEVIELPLSIIDTKYIAILLRLSSSFHNLFSRDRMDSPGVDSLRYESMLVSIFAILFKSSSL